MKLKKKEKILLGVLCVLLFVGCFYMYGIMPQSSTIDTQTAKIKELKAQVDALNLELIKYNSSSFAQLQSAVLDDYYLSKGEIYKKLERTDLERIILPIFARNGIEKYNTSGWSIDKSNMTVPYGSSSVNITVDTAKVVTGYEAGDYWALFSFIEDIRALDSIVLNGFSYEIKEDKESGEYTISGNITMTVFMLDEANLPKELPQPAADRAGKYLQWRSVDNAVSYDLYNKKTDINGKPTFEKLTAAPLKFDEGVSPSYDMAQLPEGEYELIVCANGDGDKYYKTVLYPELIGVKYSRVYA